MKKIENTLFRQTEKVITFENQRGLSMNIPPKEAIKGLANLLRSLGGALFVVENADKSITAYYEDLKYDNMAFDDKQLLAEKYGIEFKCKYERGVLLNEVIPNFEEIFDRQNVEAIDEDEIEVVDVYIKETDEWVTKKKRKVNTRFVSTLQIGVLD